MENMHLLLVAVVTVIIVVTGACATGFCTADVPDNGSNVTGSKEALAKCLSENGARMYGVDACSHCQHQKSLFGDAFQYVDYTECTRDRDACRAAGITAYPTWVIGSEIYKGALPLETLAGLSGCYYE
ncbi:MAG: hypothetical protein DRO99_03025 [Candidatus Aenigmatarchaeota archaeon]|nr:MAG: hypothetical protein DRO99_03025 [Candidatus Aenigmarchaeota archaeon]